jgi:hypothetical protein
MYLQEQVLFDSLGEITSAPSVAGIGQLTMKYVSIKNECQDINHQRNNWTTTIHFVCKKGALVILTLFLDVTIVNF